MEIDKQLIIAYARAVKGTTKPVLGMFLSFSLVPSNYIPFLCIVTTGTLVMGGSKPGHPVDDSMDASLAANRYFLILLLLFIIFFFF